MIAVAILAGAAGGTVAVAAGETVDHVNVPVPEHRSTILANGLKLILIPRHDIPLVAFNLLLRGGAQLDPPGRDGTAALAADLLTHGAGGRDAHAFVDAVEGAGGNLEAAARNEVIQVQGQFLSR